ncbi:MAG: peroxidase family protein, partial [Hyphomicrobiaceae bacterium]
LQFILDGIIVSETHAEQTNDTTSSVWDPAELETSRQILLSLIPNSFEPIGMRTLSGELNNLLQDQSTFGTTGEFPRLGEADYRDDSATGFPETGFPLGPPGAPVVTNTDYQQSGSQDNTGPGDVPDGVADGDVVDSDPRIISNLVVDLSVNNPAAIVAAGADPGTDGVFGGGDPEDTFGDGVELIDPDGVAGTGDEFFFIPNVAPDEGLSAPFNAWMTFFGQFFDHGLDLINKGGSGTVFMPLQPDDPLFDPTPGAPNFMVLTRASVDAGPDGLLGTPDDVAGPFNATSPHVDQNQTYASHPSQQLFLREYESSLTGEALATGSLIEGAGGGMATWGDVKFQARTVLGIELTDMDGINIPLFAVDQYGEFIPGADGLPQLVLQGGVLLEGNLADPIMVNADGSVVGSISGNPLGQIDGRTGFSFLVDIAHDANPVDGQTGAFKVADDDDALGLDHSVVGEDAYDNELLDAHFIAGDGRVNENFALTAVHHVFHQEHNRLVEIIKEELVSAANNVDLSTVDDPDGGAAALELLNGYLLTPVATFPTTPGEIAALEWDGNRLFQAAKFGTEMQYQHLVFEEFGRKIHPAIDVFASFEATIDPAITMEFSQAVYRLGHSMLTENVDLIDETGALTEVGLIQAFLNPLGFHQDVNSDGLVLTGDPLDASAAAGAIVRGLTRETGSEIDEFVTGALRNNLLGLPLDLAAINIARGRDVGLPTLNDAREQFFAGTADIRLKPYENWFEYALNLKHEESIINFIAAYGQHVDILAATTLADKRAVAADIVLGGGTISDVDRFAFLNGTGVWTGVETGINLVDLWIGGLAEAIEPFGGMLGSTFTFVFETQMEALQDGDRFYYLGRTAGLNFVTQLEQNSFGAMIARNTDIEGDGMHLPGDIFSVPHFILEVDQANQITNLDADGVTELPGGNGDPAGDSILIPLVIRDNPSTPIVETNFLQYTGGDHVVLGGTEDDDTLIGGIGDDTLLGDGGDDNLEGGDGSDVLIGGAGDDVLTDIGGEDNIQGGDGNDVIVSGAGEDLILAGAGKDFVLMGQDLGETFGGLGDDFIQAGTDENIFFGGEGNDWLEGNGSNNLVQGDNGDPFLNSTITGHDVFLPGLGDDDYDSGSGDDVMVGGVGIQRFEGVNGFDWA